jgi:hypothetical protein
MASVVALAASAGASALGSLAQVSVVDRDNGVTLRTYYARGEYWVAGDPGARYAIEIRNCAGGRLLAVTSVDGVNVLSGDTAAVDQAGYVFDPGERYQVTGWRKSNAEVAAFTFSDSRDSYAARTGRPANVGVIGIALFREQPQARYAPPRVAPAPATELGEAAPLAGSASSSISSAAADAPAARQLQRAPVAPGAPGVPLGTAHGEREYSYVVDTEFHRMQSRPNEVIRIRYDSLENLIAMGIVRRPHAVPRIPDAFPNSEQRHFVPDPG